MRSTRRDVPFQGIIVDLFDSRCVREVRADVADGEWCRFSPSKRKDWKVPESTVIIEYIDGHFMSGTKLIPRGSRSRAADALPGPVRRQLREPADGEDPAGRYPAGGAKRDPFGVAEARAVLDKAYRLLDARLADKSWLAGKDFTMADSRPRLGAGLPAPGPSPSRAFATWTAYFSRVAERPSFARVLREAEPYMARLAQARSGAGPVPVSPPPPGRTASASTTWRVPTDRPRESSTRRSLDDVVPRPRGAPAWNTSSSTTERTARAGSCGGLRDGGDPGGVLTYIAVKNVDDATKKIQKAGGTLVKERTTVPGYGAFVVFKAPGGPVQAIWEAST